MTTPIPPKAKVRAAAPKAKVLKVSSVSDIKKKQQGLFEMPSGLVFKLKNPGGLSAFLSGGIIPNGLMPIVTEQLNKSSGTTTDITEEELLNEASKDPDFFNDMAVMIDAVAVKCIVEPPVMPIPDGVEERDDDLLYVDEISMADKQFIFSWITTGVDDLKPFRK